MLRTNAWIVIFIFSLFYSISEVRRILIKTVIELKISNVPFQRTVDNSGYYIECCVVVLNSNPILIVYHDILIIISRINKWSGN